MTDLAQIEAALRKADALAQRGDPQAAKDAKVLADAYRSARGAAEPPKPNHRGDKAGSGTHAFLTGVANAGTFGLRDEISAGMDAVGALFTDEGVGDAYNRRLAHERAMMDQVREENPYAALGGEVAGSLLLPGASLKAGASLGTNALRMGLSGAAQGGAYGFGEGEGGLASRARSAVLPAAVGGAVGAAAPFALRGVQNALDKRATRKAIDAAADAAPPPEASKAASRAIYQAMEQRGVVFNDDASQRLVAKLDEALAGFDEDTAPVTLRKVSRLAQKAEPSASAGSGPPAPALSLSGLMNTREALSKQSLNKMTSDGAAASKALGAIDGFISDVMELDAASGDVAGLSDDWKEARALWRRFRNSERLQEIVANAEMKDNPALAIKNGFRSILSNPKKRATYSEAERRVMRQVVDETKAGSVIQRLIGYGTGLSRQVAATTAGYGLGGPVGAAIGSMAATKVGSMAKDAASDAAMTAGERAARFSAAGGQYALPPPAQATGFRNALRYAPAPAAVGVNHLSQ